MRIKVINPNTTEAMGDRMGAIAERYAANGTEIVSTSVTQGPATIESYYDDYLAVPGLLEEILVDEAEFDAFINACWDDPGIEACREVTDKPVVGIGEASMYVANMLGAKFSVVTVLPRGRDAVEKAVARAGLEDKCASIRCTDITVQETEDAREKTERALVDASREVIVEDGAEVICLGCSGMGELDATLEAELSVPVIDGVAAAVVLAEGLVRLGKTTSNVCTFKPPEPKERPGFPAIYQFTD